MARTIALLACTLFAIASATTTISPEFSCKTTRNCNRKFGKAAKLICVDRVCIERSTTRCSNTKYCKQFFSDNHKCIRKQCVVVDPSQCGSSNRYCRKTFGQEFFCNKGYCEEKPTTTTLVPPTTKQPEGFWTLGEDGEGDCNLVCRPFGLKCNGPRQAKVNTDQKLYAVADILGEDVGTPVEGTSSDVSMPFINAGVGSFKQSGRSSCVAEGVDGVQRICCCGKGKFCEIPREVADFAAP